MQVIDAMQRSVPRCAETALADEVARLMRDERVGLVVVAEGEVPVGIVTDRDIVLKVVAAGLDPAATQVGSFMSTPVRSCGPMEDLDRVVPRLDRHGLRRAPVIGPAGQVIGLLSVDEVGRAVARPLPHDLIEILSAEGRAR